MRVIIPERASSSENRSEGSCTITLKQSTEPYNCDLDGTKIEYTINKNENQKYM